MLSSVNPPDGHDAMATEPRANRPGRTSSEDDEAAEHTSETDLPAIPGTVVSPLPDLGPSAKPRPKAKSAAPAPVKARRPEPVEEELPENDPKATRILSVEAVEAPARFELLVTGGPAQGTRFPLRPGTLTVGRSAQCDCSILDEAISRRHFELHVDARSVSLRDLGSGNGTLVNGEATEELGLAHGDVIQIGDSTLELRERGKAPVSAQRRAAPGAPARQGSAAAAAAKPALNRRNMLIGGLAVFSALVVLLALAKNRQHQQQLQLATAAFERGRQELDQGDADDALQDFQLALRGYPDPAVVQEKMGVARVISDGTKALTHARDLLDQKDFAGARKVLEDIPHNDVLDAQVKKVRADVDKQEAEMQQALKAKQEEGQPVDPTTWAEANDYWQRAKKEERENLDAAQSDMEHAYDMLASRNAGGADFESLRSDYVDLLKLVYVHYRHSNRARSEMAAAKANGIVPNSVPPNGQVEVKEAAEAAPPRHAVRTHVSHHRSPSSALPRRRQVSAAPAAAPSSGGARYNESKAEDLDDEGDAMLGQNPDGARAKYQEALRYAPPGSDAAQRAHAGLGN